MKKLYILASTLLLALTSCQGEFDQPTHNDTQKSTVSFTSSINTRVADEKFEDGDQIGVFAYTPGTIYASNVNYAYNGSIFESAAPITSDVDVQISYAAVYPYNESMGSSFFFDIVKDQNQDGAYEACDLLAANVEATTSSCPELIFEHRLSQIRINVTADQDISSARLNVASLESVSYTLSNGDTEAMGSIIDVTCAESGNGSYKAIVAPQSIAAGNDFIKFIFNSKVYTWQPLEAIELEAGTAYECNITLKGGIVTFDGETKPWEEENLNASDNGTIEMKVKKAAISDIVISVDNSNFNGTYYVVAAEYDGYFTTGCFCDPTTYAETIMYNQVNVYETDLSKPDNIYIFNDSRDISLRKGYLIESETKYIVMAFGINPKGEIITEIVSEEVTTPPITIEGSVAFEVTDFDANAIKVDAKPSSEIDTYLVGVISTVDFVSLYALNAEYAAAVIANEVITAGADLSVADGVHVFKGDASIDLSEGYLIKPETMYTILAFSADVSGIVTSEVTQDAVTTPKGEEVGFAGSLDLTIGDVLSGDIVVDVTVRGEVDNYYVAAYPKAQYESIFDGEADDIARSFINNELYVYDTDLSIADDKYIFNGTSFDIHLGAVREIAPNTDYVVFAFGITPNGDIVTEVATAECTTLAK